MDRDVICEAASRFPTPFYLFDKDEASSEVRRMREVFPKRISICFSIKANPFLTGCLGDAADFVEACSFGELRICERMGLADGKIVLSGVNKSGSELLDALSVHQDRILYTAESLSQWKALDDYARLTGYPLRVLLRLTDGSQFGMDRSEIEEILAGRHGTAARAAGIHFFSGTQKKNMERTLGELDKIDECLAEWKARFGYASQVLEFGSGMSVDYFSSEKTMRAKEEEDLKALADKLRTMRYQGPVTLEFGRRIAATCGYYVTEVADLKKRTDKDGNVSHFAIVDGGIHQVTWYGQMMGMKVPPVFCLEHARGEGEEECRTYSVFGSLCSMNDVLLRSAEFPALKVGDHLVFGRCGAYSPTEGILTFLSRDLPGIVTWSEKEGLLCARKQLPTDRLNSAGSYV